MNGWEENVVGGERVSNWWQVAMSDLSFLNKLFYFHIQSLLPPPEPRGVGWFESATPLAGARPTHPSLPTPPHRWVVGVG